MNPSTEQLKKAPRLRLHFNVHEPIELVEMTVAFQGLGFEYHRYLSRIDAGSEHKANRDEVKLYITRIESNCILAELAPALPMLGQIVPVMAGANTVTDFIKNASSIIRWLQHASKQNAITQIDVPYDKKSIQSMRSVVNLVAKNRAGELGMASLTYSETSGNDSVSFEVRFDSDTCHEASIGATKALAALEMREHADKEGVLMYFYQANKDDPQTSGQTGHKALISSIHDLPLRVYVISETDRQRIRYVLNERNHNPLHTGFLVDVNVERDLRGKPKLYRVLRIHEIIYDNEDDP